MPPSAFIEPKPVNTDDPFPTRASLLHAIKDPHDSRWSEFHQTYRGLILGVARRSGLNEHEAEEVVQETAIGVARGLPNFVYDPKVCRFKTWLLNLTRWRIQDQLRRRKPHQNVDSPKIRNDETATIDRIADPSIPEFGAEWDTAWEKNLLARALERVRDRLDERQYQVFDLNVMKNWPAADVAKTLGITVATVYLTKHRVSAALKREIARLENI